MNLAEQVKEDIEALSEAAEGIIDRLGELAEEILTDLHESIGSLTAKLEAALEEE